MSGFLEIHEVSPPDDYQFYKGDKKTLEYKIKSSSPWPVRNIKIDAYTIDPDGNKTNTNYVMQIGKHVNSLMPKGEFIVDISVHLPEMYNDQYILKSGEFKGESVLCPIDVKVIAYGTEIVSRIHI